MKLLPVALNVSSKPCLVVGGGPVGRRKVATLLECDASVRVVAPELCADFDELLTQVQHEARPYHAGDCAGAMLVFACTSSLEVNDEVAEEAAAEGIWCDVATDPLGGDFHSMATVRRGGICIGISTSGGSPALARHLRGRVEKAVGPEYAALQEIMSTRRAALRRAFPERNDRTEIWRTLLSCGEVLELLRAGRREAATALVDALISGGGDIHGGGSAASN